MNPRSLIVASVLVALLWIAAPPACGQAGPPFLTNDPGTPGNGNWEINVAVAPVTFRGGASYQVPQLDLNFGVGERIQLTYEVPYVVTHVDGDGTHSGWGNSNPGIKWRFYDAGEDGWKLSIFPQVQSGATRHAQEAGIAGPGPRYLLPIEASRRVGGFEVDVEAGEYVPAHGPRERIFGLVVGRPATARLELDAEVYDDRAIRALPRQTTLGIGGRYKVRPWLIALFMAGHSVGGAATGSAQSFGYVGVQVLLSDYGARLGSGAD